MRSVVICNYFLITNVVCNTEFAVAFVVNLACSQQIKLLALFENK